MRKTYPGKWNREYKWYKEDVILNREISVSLNKKVTSKPKHEGIDGVSYMAIRKRHIPVQSSTVLEC